MHCGYGALLTFQQGCGLVGIVIGHWASSHSSGRFAGSAKHACNPLPARMPAPMGITRRLKCWRSKGYAAITVTMHTSMTTGLRRCNAAAAVVEKMVKAA